MIAACGFARQNAKPQAAFLLRRALLMLEPVVTVAKFSNPLQAELARNFLESNGIPAKVGGSDAATPIGALGGLAQLNVRKSDAELAADLLAAHLNEATLDDDWLDRVENDPSVWVCPLCGAAVSNDLAECDSCQTQREAIQTTDGLTARRPRRQRQPPPNQTGIRKPGDTTAETPERIESSDLDVEADELDPEIVAPDIKLYSGDPIASRALLAALFGLCVPIAAWCSLFMLLQLAFGKHDLSAKGKVRCFWALVIAAASCVLFALLFYSRLQR
jgi:hypothetical protein